MDANSLIEGHCKFRDGKKWKTRWAVVTKLSPVADCLQLQIYRDEKERARNGHTKASLSLEHFLALESGFTLDKESHTLAIICQDLSVVLAFDNRERLIQWSVRIANNLGEGQQFLVQLASAPTKSKLNPGPAKLHVTDRKFCLTGGIPPRLLGAWEVSHLRRYGVVDGRLVFEGGSRCGKGEGVHVLVPDQPQIPIIIDALDMSSKGQLARMPSRRFGSVTDSPRKSMTSRLSEMRNMSSVLTESTSNVCAATTTGLSLSRNMSPTPITTTRESFSADELCVHEHSMHATITTTTNVNHSSWISSDSSSRCDLDSVDNLSVMNCCEEVKSPHGAIHSPVKSHINKPLPSAMERCLSCMSKLGAQGTNQDVLSPSWTMDLNGLSAHHTHAAAATMSTSISQSQVVPKTGAGSLGSGNSDRLSISSHGSSNNGGGALAEFYYDTPRSALGRNNGRGTPPVPRDHGHHGQGGCCGHSHGTASPQRLSMRSSSTSGSTGSGCHCHGSQCGRNGHIYYSAECEQSGKSHGGGNGAKTPINLHSNVAYENYDFPRSSSQHQAAAAASNGASCAHQCGLPGSNIDWSKKHAMDRSSIASSTLTTDSHEFYDTPRRCADCCAHDLQVRSTCCSPPHHQGQQPLYQNQQHPHSRPCTHGHDPMENYDVPPPFAHPLGPQKPPAPLPTAASAGRVNGEGKMPLVAANNNPLLSTNAPIYAQVDKSKKTPKAPHAAHPNCDNNAPIYQNALPSPNTFPAQPNYMNIEPISLPPKRGQVAQGHHHHQHHHHNINDDQQKQSNYVNLDFSQSLQLYENSKDLKAPAGETTVTEPKIDLVKSSAVPPKAEAAYANVPDEAAAVVVTAENQNESKDEAEMGAAGAPLRRSSSVPCKGGHANRGSASSSDSGVSGDGGLYFEDGSPLGDFGRLCLHESLPRKGQASAGSSGGKNTSTSTTPKPPAEGAAGSETATETTPKQDPAHVYSTPKEPAVEVQNQGEEEGLTNRHYETIDEAENKVSAATIIATAQVHHHERPKNQSLKLLSSDANSTSSGASDMSDYIETLSFNSRGSNDTVNNGHHHHHPHSNNGSFTNIHQQQPHLVLAHNNVDISASPNKRAASMKPRSGKDYVKIDRSMFKD